MSLLMSRLQNNDATVRRGLPVVHIECRVLVKEGTTDARAPAKFWQRMACTHSDKGAILQNLLIDLVILG